MLKWIAKKNTQKNNIQTGDQKVYLDQFKTCTISRRKKTDIQITNDKSVSERHACILCSSTGVVVVDLSSTNGTVINGFRIKPNLQAYVKDGDIIGFGNQNDFLLVKIKNLSDKVCDFNDVKMATTTQIETKKNYNCFNVFLLL